MLGSADLRRFIEHGFFRIPQAFPRQIANRLRSALWHAAGCAPDEPGELEPTGNPSGTSA